MIHDEHVKCVTSVWLRMVRYMIITNIFEARDYFFRNCPGQCTPPLGDWGQFFEKHVDTLMKLHTEDGHYLFTPVAEDYPAEGSLYRIQSQLFKVEDFGNNFEFEFFYHMSGNGIGTFTVILSGTTTHARLFRTHFVLGTLCHVTRFVTKQSSLLLRLAVVVPKHDRRNREVLCCSQNSKAER